jgi:hypothetical protein
MRSRYTLSPPEYSGAAPKPSEMPFGKQTSGLTILAFSRSANTVQSGPDIELQITVNMMDCKRSEIAYSVKTTHGELVKCPDKALNKDPHTLDPKSTTYHLSHSNTSLPITVFAVQAAGPWVVLVNRATFKGIEVLFAAGIVPGSSGGDWVALTLVAIFPQRVAA